jgi:hypothetical protein
MVSGFMRKMMKISLENLDKFYNDMFEYYSKEYNKTDENDTETTLVDLIIKPFRNTNGYITGFRVSKLLHRWREDLFSAFGSGNVDELVLMEETTYLQDEHNKDLEKYVE